MPLDLTRSLALGARAERFLPGGVDSPVRAFRAVGGHPPFVASASGAYLTDADNNRYIDLFGSWGPMLLGHAFPPAVEAIQQAAARSASFGASTADEANLAELVVQCFPSIEKLRFVSSGTEACMSAIRLARGFTNRPFVIKFEGCYHGHADALLVKAGSGVATFGIPGSAGVPNETAMHTLALPYNDLSAVEAVFASHPGLIACVILEPIVGNAGTIAPAPGFLAGLRTLTREHGALLIYDEVMTGFRLAAGGAQELYGCTSADAKPDLTTLGKIIGGGLPCGAFGGRADVMDHLAPLGPVYQAGTLSGNPLAMAAGIATLSHILTHKSTIYPQLEATTAAIAKASPSPPQSMAWRLPPTASAACSHGSSRRRPSLTLRQPAHPIRPSSRSFTMPCSSVACGCRPASMRPRSSPLRIRRRKQTRWSKQRKMPSSIFSAKGGGGGGDWRASAC